ncbi:hypothetical protein J3459_008061 [Metarhizium acridum]|uniref:uncharacterized protein n=1 Tax=Metarhizium acridum TaxID=92637 RepID=UPI001C6B78D0|nr:hypothetical protein J3458_000917 [Metarhizium acridum]KAG8426532.1 hypothetical protein J3459_008061 [Metarhizium acridum]
MRIALRHPKVTTHRKTATAMRGLLRACANRLLKVSTRKNRNTPCNGLLVRDLVKQNASTRQGSSTTHSFMAAIGRYITSDLSTLLMFGYMVNVAAWRVTVSEHMQDHPPHQDQSSDNLVKLVS